MGNQAESMMQDQIEGSQSENEELRQLLQFALEALEHHREQTRPIGRCDNVIKMLRSRLGV